MTMLYCLRFVVITAIMATAIAASAAAPLPSLNVVVRDMVNGQTIAYKQALCLPTVEGKSDKTGENIRPEIRWSDSPTNTKSFAVFMMDPDVPADFTDAGKEGKVLAADAKRQDFYHWGVVNIPADVRTLAGGAPGSSVSSGTELTNDLGINGYITPPNAFGGPCPPWNDARVHHYHFIVLALNTANVTVTDKMTAKEMFGRLIDSNALLASGTVIGTYTLNPSLRAAQK
jgi:phosphatidylethanolamine-binding protein (PEBP) family uncharacterized protein